MSGLFGVLDRARTCDPKLRRLVLCPTELRGRNVILYISLRVLVKFCLPEGGGSVIVS